MDSQSSQQPNSAALITNSYPRQSRIRFGNRRAQTACAFCRWKKVRCNVGEGVPCANCVFEEIECIIVDKKRRRPRRPYEPPAASSQTPKSLPSQTSNSTSSATKSPSNTFSIPSNTSETADAYTSRHDRLRSSHPRTSPTSTESQSEFSLPTLPVVRDDGSIDFNVLLPPPPPTEERPLSKRLPAYVTPFPKSFPPDDIEYLRKKGALSIPEDALRNALLQSYIEFVHPMLPVVDIFDLVETIEAPHQKKQRISLILLQAILFAGCAWVDIKLLRRLGFLTRKAARKALFQKARALYDADYEQDSLALVQTLVLLSLWWEKPNSQKDGWYWIGLAGSLAQTIELNRDPSNMGFDLKTQRLRKRIWWCCLIRDPIVSLGTNRPARIKLEDSDMPMLTLEDFEIRELSPDISCVPLTCEIARNLEQQRRLASLCIAKTRLCRSMSCILSYDYQSLPRGHLPLYSDRNEQFEKVPPRPFDDKDAERIQYCEDHLRAWRDTLPDETKYRPPGFDPMERFDKIYCVHRALVAMMYYNTIALIHRPRVARYPEIPPATAQCGLNSRVQVRYAAGQVIRIVMELFEADIVHLLNATGLSCLVPAGMSQVDDIYSNDEEVRKMARKRFEQCKQLLHEFRDDQYAANWAVPILEACLARKRQEYLSHQEPDPSSVQTIQNHPSPQLDSQIESDPSLPPHNGLFHVSNDDPFLEFLSTEDTGTVLSWPDSQNMGTDEWHNFFIGGQSSVFDDISQGPVNNPYDIRTLWGDFTLNANDQQWFHVDS